MNSTYAPAAITSAQSRFLNSLLDEAKEMLDRITELTGDRRIPAREAVREMRCKVNEMIKVEASKAISDAMTNNKILREELKSIGAEIRPERRTTFVSEPGMYRVGDRIFKVLPSRSSNRHYAKELVGFHWEDGRPVSDDNSANLRFVIAKGAMALIGEEHRMNPEQERAFGAVVGNCIDCGKLLTKPESIAYGKGPVCSDNYTR